MKTIEINGKRTPLSFSPYALILYKQEIGLEPLDVVIPQLSILASTFDKVLKEKEVTTDDILAITNMIGESGHINLYAIVWAFAKAADESIPDFREWMYELEPLPIVDVIIEIAPDFINALITKKKVNPSGLILLMKILESNFS